METEGVDSLEAPPEVLSEEAMKVPGHDVAHMGVSCMWLRGRLTTSHGIVSLRDSASARVILLRKLCINMLADVE